MSEFFAELIGRADQRRPVLARRQRAIFEPVTPRRGPLPSARAAFTEVLAEEETVVVVQNRAIGSTPQARVDAETPPPRPEAAPAPGPVRVASGRLLATRSAAAAESGHGTRTTQPTAAQAPLATPLRRRLEDNGLTGVEAPAIRPPTQPASSVVTGTAPPPLFSPAPRSIDRPADEPSARTSSPRREDRTPVTPSRFAERSQEPAVVVKAFTKPAAVPGVERVVALARAVQPKLAVVPAVRSPSAPRSVQITIGRVEVRASSPPESRQQPAAKPTAPKLSLEQYLRDRSTGAR